MDAEATPAGESRSAATTTTESEATAGGDGQSSEARSQTTEASEQKSTATGTESNATSQDVAAKAEVEGGKPAETAEPKGATITRGRRPRAAVGVEDYEQKVQQAIPVLRKDIARGKELPGVARVDSPVAGGVTAGELSKTGSGSRPPETGSASQETTTDGQTTRDTQTQTPADDEDETKLPDRVRLGGLPDTDKAHLIAAKAIATAEKIPLADAMARVTGRGQKAEDRGQKPEENQSAEQGRPPEQIRADIAAKKTAKKEAAHKLDTDAMVDLDDEIDTLRDELHETERKLERQTQERQSREQQEFSQQVNSAKQMTVAVYPQAADENSALTQKMIEIADRMEAQENPLVFSADAPFKIAQMAANELGIAPRDPKAVGQKTENRGQQNKESSTSAAAVAATKPQATRQTAVLPKPAGAPVSGAARTTQQGANGQGGVDLKQIKSVADYEEAEEALLAGRR